MEEADIVRSFCKRGNVSARDVSLVTRMNNYLNASGSAVATQPVKTHVCLLNK